MFNIAVLFALCHCFKAEDNSHNFGVNWKWAKEAYIMFSPIFFSDFVYFLSACIFCIIRLNLQGFCSYLLSTFITWYHRDKLHTYGIKESLYYFTKWNCVKVNNILSIKKRWFEIVHGLNSFFSSKIKLKILKPNNWLKIESSSIWKPRKLLHTPIIQFC